jgi:cysteinyl-tRNA synthetase
MYCCGPTVYNYAHIGNLRTYIFEDILRRTLEQNGLTVSHVMNITDVGHLESDADQGDDKMAISAQREKKSPFAIAKFYETAFFRDLELLHIKSPTIICRATEHIDAMQEFIKVLEKKGYTYTVDGNVYFRINKFKTYADLSRRKLDDLISGARVEIDSRKENPLDFVLWFSTSKFPNQIMKWDSPWGLGFPGWHIECSAMASKYLGDRIDIHCGGIDHISIHHTNEIAQSEAYFGHSWVNVWMHGEFLVLQKEKMSKSVGNFLTLTSLTDMGYHPLHYRYLALGSHYRSLLFFSFEALDGARNAFESLRNRVLSYKLNPENPKNAIRTKELRVKFLSAINNDLDMPIALSIVWETLKDQTISTTEKLTLIKEFDAILGLGVDEFLPPQLSEEHMALVKQREDARHNKDYKTADDLRIKLQKEGIAIRDTKEGTQWYLD